MRSIDRCTLQRECLSDLHRDVQNFDQVLVPPDHVSRSPNDTYYVDPNTVLRCHTSAHQAELLAAGNKAFLVTGEFAAKVTDDSTELSLWVCITIDLAKLVCRPLPVHSAA